MALSAVLVLPVLSAPAEAAGTGVVTGRVIDDATGLPVVNATMNLVKNVGGGYWAMASSRTAVTSANGTFAASGLEWGTYRVGAFSTQSHVGRFHVRGNGTGATSFASGSDVVVHEGETTSGIVIREPAAAHITGRIVDAGSAPVASADVMAMQLGGNPASYSSVRAVRTDANGRYDLGGLESGQFKVKVKPGGNLLEQYFPNAATAGQASDVSVTLGRTTQGINMSVTAGGVISGTVRRDGTHQPVAGGRVKVSTMDGARDVFTDVASDGTFSVPGMRSGDYRVQFFNLAKALGEYYRDASTFETATPVHVVAGASTVLRDISVAATGSIRGRVTDGSGKPLASIGLYAAGRRWSTDSDGRYMVTDVQPGTHSIGFGSDAYLHKEVSGIRVAQGQDVEGVNVQLVKGATVSGTLRAPDGTPRAGAPVDSLRTSSGGTTLGVKSVKTSSNGGFKIAGLEAGTYTLVFYPSSSYAKTYLGGASRLESADTFDLAAGQERTGVDGTVMPEARVSGRVLLNGAALAGKPVDVAPVDPDTYLPSSAHVRTSEGGTWAAGYLDPGRYRVTFYCDVSTAFSSASAEVAGIAYVDLTAGHPVVLDRSFPASACAIRTRATPKFSSSSRVGSVARITKGSYLPTSTTERYSWYVGSRRLSTTSSALRLASAYRGKQVTARVTSSRPGYQTRTFTFKSAKIR